MMTIFIWLWNDPVIYLYFIPVSFTYAFLFFVHLQWEKMPISPPDEFSIQFKCLPDSCHVFLKGNLAGWNEVNAYNCLAKHGKGESNPSEDDF